MKRVLIAGFGQPVIDLFTAFNGKFEIVGIITDYDRKTKFPLFYDFLSYEKISLFSFDDVEKLKVDAVIVINFNKIIDVSTIKVPFLLNIHMGLLPVYRGNSANSWSILNGDLKVGYTLHEINSILDGGRIFYKFEYYIKTGETYFNAKKAINHDIVNNLPAIIDKVLDKKRIGIEQKNEGFIYASRLIPEDGLLKGWNYKTDDIIRRYIVFSKPLGTGLKVLIHGKLVELAKISLVDNYLNSNGIPGSVVMKNLDGSIWVKTKDTVISIDEIIIDEQIIKPSDKFKIGDRI